MQQEQRTGRRSVTRHMQEMQVDAAESDLVLREGVEPRLLRAPVEPAAPIPDKRAHVIEVAAVGPGLAWRLVGEAGPRQTVLQIADRRLVDRQSERHGSWRHGIPPAELQGL
jgi:hypothetical protein